MRSDGELQAELLPPEDGQHAAPVARRPRRAGAWLRLRGTLSTLASVPITL